MAALDPDARITLVETLDDALDMRAWLGERRSGGWLGVDTEASGLNLGRDSIRLFQCGDLARGWALDWSEWRGVVRDTLPLYDRPIAFHNSTFDLAVLAKDGVRVREHLVDDTMIMAHLVNPAGRIGLKPLAARLVGAEAMMGKDALDEAFRQGRWDWGTIPVDHPDYWYYACMDTMMTVGIAEELWPTVKERYERVYEVELACIHVMMEARLKGMMTDQEYVVRTRAQLVSDMAGLREQIPVAPGKDRLVMELLEERGGRGPLGGWWPFRTEKGAVSIDDDALSYFEHEFPDLITPLRAWRKKSKIVGTYLNNIIADAVDGVLRCSIHPVGARTGRMSVTGPALQTLPRGRVVRDAFVARPGCKLLLADYSQAEARVFASHANCVPMIESFKRGEDQHLWVASLCYTGGDMSSVRPLQRQVAKNVGFANIYGAGDAKIAATAGVEISVIEDFKHRYNELFPEVDEFKQLLIGEMHRRIREEGEAYVTTAMGRRLVVDRDKPYVGLNYLCQGGATGDVLKLKVVELDAAGLGPFVRLAIHDEVILEVPDEDVDDAVEVLDRVMPERSLYVCPLEIEVDVVERWAEHYENDPTNRSHWVPRRL